MRLLQRDYVSLQLDSALFVVWSRASSDFGRDDHSMAALQRDAPGNRAYGPKA